jgi:hypothetical protein
MSGYTTPHTIIGLENGNNLVTMIGANTDSTAPGGVVELNGETGKFVSAFGPTANRDFNKIPPKYMYDAGIKLELNRMVTTSFGLPKHVGPGGKNAGLFRPNILVLVLVRWRCAGGQRKVQP